MTCPKCNTRKRERGTKGVLRATCSECRKPNKLAKNKQFFTRNYAKRKPYRSFKKDKCELCLFIPVHLCQLDVDHIDGNHFNNDPLNLQTLCANCHRLKTYTAKQFGRKKKSFNN